MRHPKQLASLAALGLVTACAASGNKVGLVPGNDGGADFPGAGDTVSAPIVDPARIEAAILRGLRYIEEQQQPNGEYPAPCLRNVDGQLVAGNPRVSPNVFSTGVMLYSLAVRAEFRTTASAERALDFLANEMQADGTWRFYTRTSERYSIMLSDVDDTAVISQALAEYGRIPPDNTSLLLAQADAEGALLTWIFPPGYPIQETYDNVTADEHFAIRNPDPVVNAHALAYLTSRGVAAPRVCDYLAREAQAGTSLEDADYYLRWPMVTYAYAKALRSGATDLQPALEALAQPLVDSRTGEGWAGDLDTALALNSLLALRSPPGVVHEAAAHLIETQSPEGSWAADLYFGSKRHPNTGWGSPSLTTAFAVEALTRYGTYAASL